MKSFIILLFGCSLILGPDGPLIRNIAPVIQVQSDNREQSPAAKANIFATEIGENLIKPVIVFLGKTTASTRQKNDTSAILHSEARYRNKVPP